MFQCTTIAHVDPDKVDEVLAAARVLAEATRAQHGNISYNVALSEGQPGVLVISERWETAGDFQEHVAHDSEPGDPVCEFGKVIGPASTQPPSIHPGEIVV